MNVFGNLSKPKSTSTKNIFISYREKDTAGETGRLLDDLKEHFSDDHIFMDIEKIEPGTDFSQAISESLKSCDVLLAVIGPHWMGRYEASEPSRLNDPNDWVRLEIATALRRNIRVIPVLVDGGALPPANELPPDLQPLLRRQAYEISNKRWKYDTDELIQFLKTTVGIPAKADEIQENGVKKKSFFVRNALWLIIILSLLTFSLSQILTSKNKTQPTHLSTNNPTDTAQSSVPEPVTFTDTLTEQTNKKTTANTAYATVEGKWIEVDEGEKSTFIIQQNKNKISVQVYALGQQISSGSGTVENRQVKFDFNLFGSETKFKAQLSANGKQLKGTYTMESTGVPQNILLQKSQ